MKTKIRKADINNINRDIVKEAGEILRSGGLVAFPTETVYGLGADALNEHASHKIYEAKGRPSDNPLIVHIADIADMDKIAVHVPKDAYKIAERFWPGPLTMIFEKTNAVPYGTTGGLNSVAVRMPSHRMAIEIIKAGGGFIAAPSANTSGRPSPTTAQHVVEDLAGRIELIVDGGAVEIGVESTILDMTVTPPMILRPGAVTRRMLVDLIGEVGMDSGLIDSNSSQAPKAPGMKYRHYAPQAELTVVEGSPSAVIEEINQLVKEKEAGGFRVGVIATEESVSAYESGVVKSIGTRLDEHTIANGLYRVLREFDIDEVDYIYSESFLDTGLGNAIMNRLLKAAGQHVIKL